MVKPARLLTLGLFSAVVIGASMADARQALAATAAESNKLSPASGYFDKGMQLLNAGNYKLSAKAFADAIKADPSAAGARINLGVALCSLHDYANALHQLDEALKLYPNNAYALSQRALCKLGLRDYAGSIADFDRSNTLSPGSPIVLSNRGVSKMESGDFDGAGDDFAAALKLAPGDADVLNNIKVLEGVKSAPGMGVQAAVKRALNTMGVLDLSGKESESTPPAVAAIAKKLQPHPTKPGYEVPLADIIDSHYYDACKLIVATKYKEAIHELDQVLPNGRDTEYYLCRAAAHAKLGELKPALADCNSAIALDPKEINGYINRCSINADLGDGEGALRDADRALQLNSEATEDRKIQKTQPLYLNRGRAYLLLRDWPNAITDFNKAIEIDAHSALAFHHRAIAHFESNDHDQAISDFLHAAELYGSIGNNEAATECSTKAKELADKARS